MVAATMEATLFSTLDVTDETRWQAVQTRDRARDGEFVFAVRTTGIYCRPSCPSRRPKRKNVTFFHLPELAERAGFRSCLRCKPKLAVAADPQLEIIQRVCRSIESSTGEAPKLEALAAEVQISPHHLQRTFKRIVGISPRQYADACRLERFKAEVKTSDSVTRAMYDAGYGSSRGLYERANEKLGMTPSHYRRGGKGMRISYLVAESPLGKLLVAATERGVCAVRLGDSSKEIEADLYREFPEAEMRRSDSKRDPSLTRSVQSILEHLAGQRPDLNLPLDVQATAFQWRVWEELRAIPYGETASYSDVAKSIGRPTAVRAVARACATNPVALVIPCHRVVREDKSLGGYRWGIERKRALLDREQTTK